ncbi:MAG: MATE family efflux transporter [bacterium]
MKEDNNLISIIKGLLLFAVPIILGQVGQMLIGAGDVFVAAKHGTATVASISIANAVINTVLLTGLGFLFSISPVLAKKRGEKQKINSFFKITLIYSLLLAFIFGLISLLTIPIIPYLGFERKLIPDIQEFIFICSFSFFGAYLYQALKEFLQVHEKLYFANLISIVAVLLNVVLCWIFVFGFGFIPSLGVKGLAIASLSVRTIMGLTLLIYCRKYFKEVFLINIKYLKNIMRIGYPIAISLLLELSAFGLVTILAGQISTIQVAANNIVLTLSSITYMLPLSVANALSVKVGYAYGSRNYKSIKKNIIAGLILSLSIMGFFALMFFVFPAFFIELFSNDKGIIKIGARLLFIVAIFQLFDGVQITLSGALRGLGYTKPIIYTMALGYWAIGIPIGVYFAFSQKLDVFGLWIGFAIALFSCANIFLFFIIKKLKELKLELI